MERCGRKGLGNVTQSEVAALAEFALSSPGVVLGRSLYRFDRDCMAKGKYGQLLKQAGTGSVPISTGRFSKRFLPAAASVTRMLSRKQLLQETWNQFWMSIFGLLANSTPMR